MEHSSQITSEAKRAELITMETESEPAIAVRKFLYQKDMSEYCRRRVIPSIFLGKHVVDANSQILHFSRMELPYSCFISVRSESGSNIIFFIQLVSEDSLKSACSESGNQLLVYEMGETFGGYWGPLPENLVKRKNQQKNKYYTLKTTQSTAATTKLSTEEESEYSVSEATDIVSQTTSTNKQAEDNGDYIRMEIPIINVSGHLVPGNDQPKDLDIDETFDLIYDVAPRRGEQYKTSILPLVQFSISEQKGPRRSGDTAAAPRYELDYDINNFTPDSRLTYPNDIPKLTSTKKRKYKYSYNANRRLKYRKNNRLFAARKPFLYLKQRFTTSPLTLKQTSSLYDIHFYANSSIIGDLQQIPTTILMNDTKVQYENSWAYINNLMETIKRNTETDNLEKSEESMNVSSLLHNLTNIHHNFSAYLNSEQYSELAPFENKSVFKTFIPNAKSSTLSISTYYDPEYDTSTEVIISDKNADEEKSDYEIVENIVPQSLKPDFVNTLEDIPTDTEMNMSSLNKSHNETNIKPKEDLEYASIKNINSQTINYNSNTQNTDSLINISNIKIFEKDENSTAIKSTQMLTTSLTTSTVDHESWENVVQAASDMAVILNRAYDNNYKNTSDDEKNERDKVRKKRFIHSVPIEDARPHSLSTKKNIQTTTMATYKIAHMQDFAQLAELQDDEMHGRVALRYLRHYVGPVMLNICDYHESKDRQVYLFNSSRIVIAITNFTMDRITIVVTSAHTLLNPETRCSSAHLECQISGTRVCIDSMSACDGVPNCGTYDIYDEDRLMCGAAVGLKHNVCLAAFTFLAVVLTMLYTVHYWLKRCVPKVSDAFFIYSNGAENILYLDTIMRSPNDLDDDSKMDYRAGNIFDDDIIYSSPREKPSNTFMNFISKLPGFKLSKHKHKTECPEDTLNSEFYSTNMEPRRMYSFTKFEIQKIIGKESNDAAVQTGESLEMEHLERMKMKEVTNIRTESSSKKHAKSTLKSQMPMDDTALATLENTSYRQSQIDELSILNFLKDVRSESVGSTSIEKRQYSKKTIKSDITKEEKELRCHTYEFHGMYEAGPSGNTKYDNTSQTLPPELSGQVRKHLRFEEEATTIPEEYEEDQTEGKESQGRQSISFIRGKIWRALDFNTAAEDNVESTRTATEHKSFWGDNKKVKKSKRK